MKPGYEEAPTNNYHLISKTAGIMAFLRSFSDIPNAKSISDDVDGESIARAIYAEDFDLLTRICAPMVEARYKCFDRFIQGYRNILEIAVGAAVGRGIDIANRHHDKTYVGTDLPDMMQEAVSLFRKYYLHRDNHHLLPANVMCREELDAAVDIFPSGEILIINEGLWMYLAAEERFAGAMNIRSVLERTGGVWVTPDFTDREYENYVLSSLDPDVARSLNKPDAAVRKLVEAEVQVFS